MTVVLVQFLFSALAGAALYAMWRAMSRRDRVFGMVVGLGLLGRSILGQVLFWISWLELIPRGIHTGRGIWFFGFDGYHYMIAAAEAASGGPLELLSRSRGSTAATYLDLLSSFALLFGAVASVGLLLNLFCYLGTCMIIARFGRVTSEARPPALFAVVAMTFYPAGVLWSLQPLKDPLSHFLLVVLAGSALLWQRAWRTGGPALWIAAAFAGMVVSVYGITGTRWYLGLAVLGAAGIFLFLIVVTTRTRWMVLAGTSAVLFVLLTRVFLVGGGAMVPPPLRRVLDHPIGRAPSSSVERTEAGSDEFAATMVAYTENVRGRFSRTRGATEIQLPANASPVMRWSAGLVAILVPHFVIEHSSFVHIGGGRGLFWFADLDTIVFDIVISTAIVLVLRRWRLASLSNALFWLVALTAVFIAVPLLYAITNFGALLRFRGMMYVLFAMAPLVAVIGASRTWSPLDRLRPGNAP